MPDPNREMLDKLAVLIERVISEIPTSKLKKSNSPDIEARALIDRYAVQTAAISGGLSLPPGVFGLLTILPDLAMLWRSQTQMVADLAALYGKSENLVPEIMLYCLFKHSTSPVIRSVVESASQGLVIRRSSWQVVQKVTEGIAIRVAQRITRLIVSRFVPIIGAVAVASYAYKDTKSVGSTTLYFLMNDTIIYEDGNELLHIGTETRLK